MRVQVWGLGGCFGLGQAVFLLAQGGVGVAQDGFWECGFGVWGGAGWVSGLVGGVLESGGLRCGMGG